MQTGTSWLGICEGDTLLNSSVTSRDKAKCKYLIVTSFADREIIARSVFRENLPNVLLGLGCLVF